MLRAEHDRLRYAAHKKITNALKDIPCMDCGQKFPSVCMDFDHRNPEEKKFSIASAAGRNVQSIMDEIEKCDIVCANCHRLRTWLC